MSYSTDVPVSYDEKRLDRMGPRLGHGMSVATFAGVTGREIQITLSGGTFVQLDYRQQDELMAVLAFAKVESLVRWPFPLPGESYA